MQFKRVMLDCLTGSTAFMLVVIRFVVALTHCVTKSHLLSNKRSLREQISHVLASSIVRATSSSEGWQLIECFKQRQQQASVLEKQQRQ
eukprot:456584-Amphidinium_carterae.1